MAERDKQSQATLRPLAASLVQRVSQGVRYMLTGVSPANFFGPDQPQQPIAQESQGRAWDYRTGINTRTIPREEAAISFHELRALADNLPILRLGIETRKDQMERLAWNIRLREKQPGQSTPGKKPAPADPRIANLEAFFRKPDGRNSFGTWLRLLLEDLLVLDAPALYVRPTVGGGIFAFEPVDGSTIKRIIGLDGRTPLPPDPAYQQILKGVAASSYTTDELIYRPRNPRIHKIYGMSPVEQIVMTVNIALRREVSTLQYYTEGNTPDALIGVPEDWTPDQTKQFQDYWDSMLEGNLAARRHTRFVPGGLKYQPTKEPALKDDYDEWIARIVCYALSLPPTPFIKQMNRATANTAQDAALEEGLAPLQQWVKLLIDDILETYFKSPDLEFAWSEDAVTDPLVAMQVETGYVDAGIKTRNEARAALGLDPLGADGDQITVQTGASVTLLADIIDPPKPPPPAFPPHLMLPAPAGKDGKPDEQTAPGKEQAGKESPEKDQPQKLAKLGGLWQPDPVPRNRKAVRQARQQIRQAVTPFLKAAAKQVADRIRAMAKADGDGGNSDDPTADLDWTILQDPLEDTLRELTTDSVREALLQVKVSDAGITSQTNEDAVLYARNRAATLLGKRWDGGELIDNPDPKYAISETTRQAVQDLVKRAETEGWSNDKLADAVEGDFTFSPARARMIARTETAFADSQGNMTAWRRSGVVIGKRWLLATNHPEPDECDDNADDGVIGLDDQFSSGVDAPPDHPNCECAVVPVVAGLES
jgi:hypothetical protein